MKRIRNQVARDTLAFLAAHAATYEHIVIDGVVYDVSAKLGLGNVRDFPNARDVAYTIEAPTMAIKFNPRALEHREMHELLGVLYHELGHVFEVRYGVEAARRVIRAGQECPSSREERRADQLAEVLTGDHIYYTDEFVQTILPTEITIRPRHLG